MDLEHPTWCTPRRCCAAISGTHKSEPIEIIHSTSRANAWLQQQPSDGAFLALVTAHHGVGAPVAFLPLAEARTLLAQTGGLVTQAGDAPVAFLPLAKARTLLAQTGELVTQAGDAPAATPR